MSIEFICPTVDCKKRLSVRDEKAGGKIRCPNCREIILAPVQSGDAPQTLAANDPEHSVDSSAVEQLEPILEERGRARGTLGHEKEIAQGGMGKVMLCSDMSLDRSVAMKIMQAGIAESEEHRLRFLEEAQITGKLEHPNIVPVHELGKDGEGNLYFTMKHVKGQSLGEILHRSSPAVSKGQVIVATVLGQVAGFDRTSGRQVWEASASSIEDGIWASPAVTGDSVAVTSTDGWLYLFDIKSHKLTWAFDTRSPIYASPAIANGTIFTANTSGHVMAFGQGNAVSTELAPREPRDLDWAVSFPVQNSFWSLVGTVESFKSQPMKTWLKTGPRSRYRKDRGDLLDFLFTLKVERGGGKRYDLGTGKPVMINTGDVVSACSRPPTTYNQLHLSPTQVGPPAEMKNRRRVRLVCALESPLNPLIPKGKRPFSAYLIQVQPLNDDITPPEHWPVWHYNNWIHFTTEIEEKRHAQALGGLGLEFVGWGTCDERVHARYFPGPWWQRMKLHTYTQRTVDFYKIAMHPKTRRWRALPLHTPGMQVGVPPDESARYNRRPTCEIIADLTKGKAPLTVQFSANATDSDGKILWTTWDFDVADGIGIDSGNRRTQFTFREPGRSIVSLTAMDNGLMPAFSHAVITVEP